MDWNADMNVTQVGDYSFSATIGEHWSSLQGAHGGVVAALAVRSAQQTLAGLGIESNTTLRAATFGYASGNVPGELTIDVDVIRRGRTMVTAHASVTQNGKSTTLARLHFASPWDGVEFSDAPAPPQRPAELVRLDQNARVTHLNNVETHLDATTIPFSGAKRGEWRAWCRPHHGGTFDATWLTMFGDFFPPAVFARTSGPSRAVTIEYSIQIHDAAGQWIIEENDLMPTRMHVFHSHDGFAVEDGWIWLPNGDLLATVRQTRLAG